MKSADSLPDFADDESALPKEGGPVIGGPSPVAVTPLNNIVSLRTPLSPVTGPDPDMDDEGKEDYESIPGLETFNLQKDK